MSAPVIAAARGCVRQQLPRIASLLLMVMLGLVGAAAAQRDWGDVAAITTFQRAADSYAFVHRQAERQLGNAVVAAKLAAAIRATGALSPGSLFTAAVVEEFRSIAARAVRRGCDAGELRSGVWDLLHTANTSAAGTAAVAPCMTQVLPTLPPELEYRSAGTVLLVVDTHANLVVDVLPALLAGSDLR